MKFKIKKRFMLGGYQERPNVNIYTLVDFPKFGDPMTIIGVKEDGISDRDLVDAEIKISITKRVLYDYDKNTGEYKKVYVNDANVFIESLEKVEEKGGKQ